MIFDISEGVSTLSAQFNEHSDGIFSAAGNCGMKPAQDDAPPVGIPSCEEAALWAIDIDELRRIELPAGG